MTNQKTYSVEIKAPVKTPQECFDELLQISKGNESTIEGYLENVLFNDFKQALEEMRRKLDERIKS